MASNFVITNVAPATEMISFESIKENFYRMELFVILSILAGIWVSTGAIDPEVTMDAEQLIRYWSYPFESYEVQTDDGYVLTLFRIKHERMGSCSPSIGPPFVLAHGLGASAEHWLMNPPDSNPAFILADAGFDVWLLNFRGSKYSKKHIQFTKENKDFWRFSWDQMAQYDIPATIDGILRVNGAKRVYYAGHSQGTTILFAKLAREPEFAVKIARFFALAPIITSKYMRGPMTTLFFLQPNLQQMENMSGPREYTPTQIYGQIMNDLICKFAPLGAICESILSLMGGSSEHGVFNVTRSPVYLSHYSGTSSMRNFIHRGQMIWKDQTSMYDFGGEMTNRFHYGQTFPPVYNFTAIRDVPIHLFYSANDNIATAEDVEREILPKHLRKEVVKDVVKVHGYGHFDFVYGINLKSAIFDRIIKVIRTEDGFSGGCAFIRTTF